VSQIRDKFLAKADAYEAMAASAAQAFLQCRYRSLARYWTILAEEAPPMAGDYVNSLEQRLEKQPG
jgi:hypothetical protein